MRAANAPSGLKILSGIFGVSSLYVITGNLFIHKNVTFTLLINTVINTYHLVCQADLFLTQLQRVRFLAGNRFHCYESDLNGSPSLETPSSRISRGSFGLGDQLDRMSLLTPHLRLRAICEAGRCRCRCRWQSTTREDLLRQHRLPRGNRTGRPPMQPIAAEIRALSASGVWPRRAFKAVA